MYHLPSSHAICAYKILVNHLEQHYKDPSVFHNVSTIRYLVCETQNKYFSFIIAYKITVYFI